MASILVQITGKHPAVMTLEMNCLFGDSANRYTIEELDEEWKPFPPSAPKRARFLLVRGPTEPECSVPSWFSVLLNCSFVQAVFSPLLTDLPSAVRASLLERIAAAGVSAEETLVCNQEPRLVTVAFKTRSTQQRTELLEPVAGLELSALCVPVPFALVPPRVALLYQRQPVVAKKAAPGVQSPVMVAQWLGDGPSGEGPPNAALLQRLALKHRPWCGTTSMDPTVALAMANMAHVRQAHHVLDPFAGSGGVLLACAARGARVWAADADHTALCTHSATIFHNFSYHGLPPPEVLVTAVRPPEVASVAPWRAAGFFDSIVTDPPYGVRESTEGATAPTELFVALLGMATALLRPGGRLVFCCPVFADDLVLFDSDGGITWLQTRFGERNIHMFQFIGAARHAVDRGAGIGTGMAGTGTWYRAIVVLRRRGGEGAVCCGWIPVHNGLLTQEGLVTTKEDPVALHAGRAKSYAVSREQHTGRNADVWRAAWCGDSAGIESFVSDSGNPNVLDPKGRSPLIFAAGYNQQAAAATLLRLGADPNLVPTCGESPFGRAARFGHMAVVECLLSFGANPGIRDGKGCLPLHWASAFGHAAIVSRILAVNPEIVDDLVAAGSTAGVDDQRVVTTAAPSANWTPRAGSTSAHIAAEWGTAPCLRVLIDNGANPNLRDAASDATPLHYSARQGHVECIRILLGNGASPLATDASGNTPLHEACRWSRPAAVAALVGHCTGSEALLMQNINGQTPADLCSHPAVTATLAGARVS
eukprot:TRINITY_DN41465_c0_g1_i1.p1 TRINITY_DN41465_c0_g1~~TRINITY_DN41465_c0_g1_i1.p1  ORF type:complete len:763 (+),score=67.36 TRINITY_DN41465_c0_g1_i1:1248-3536(+)